MPIKIPNDLPATKTLTSENIFVMTETRAMTQDIRPLKVLLLNLMPKKIETETQISRLIGNTPLQVELELVMVGSHKSKNTPEEHLLAFYKTFEEIKKPMEVAAAQTPSFITGILIIIRYMSWFVNRQSMYKM